MRVLVLRHKKPEGTLLLTSNFGQRIATECFKALNLFSVTGKTKYTMVIPIFLKDR